MAKNCKEILEVADDFEIESAFLDEMSEEDVGSFLLILKNPELNSCSGVISILSTMGVERSKINPELSELVVNGLIDALPKQTSKEVDYVIFDTIGCLLDPVLLRKIKENNSFDGAGREKFIRITIPRALSFGRITHADRKKFLTVKKDMI